MCIAEEYNLLAEVLLEDGRLEETGCPGEVWEALGPWLLLLFWKGCGHAMATKFCLPLEDSLNADILEL